MPRPTLDSALSIFDVALDLAAEALAQGDAEHAAVVLAVLRELVADILVGVELGPWLRRTRDLIEDRPDLEAVGLGDLMDEVEAELGKGCIDDCEACSQGLACPAPGCEGVFELADDIAEHGPF